MTEATAEPRERPERERNEVGTDAGATLYRQGETIRETVEKSAETLPTLERMLSATVMSTKSTEQILIDILDQLGKLTVDVSNIGDRIIEMQSWQESTRDQLNNMQLQGIDTYTISKGIDSTLNTFVGWFSPLLKDFHDSSIVPTLNKLLGKVDGLAESHADILAVVEAGKAQIDPLITKLQESPILRMLGVKNDV